MKTDTDAKHLFQILILIVVCLILFSNTLPNEFIWDDTALITNNSYIKNYRNIPLFFTPHYWNNLHSFENRGDYRPVRTVSFSLDYLFWKTDPAGYHLTNLALHAINVILVYLLISLLCRDSENRMMESSPLSFFSLPFLTALLFAAHPVHVESVTYIKNRAELLCFMFFLLSFFITIYADRKKKEKNGLLFLAALFLFCLALLAKETALILPIIYLAYIACFYPEIKKGALVKIFSWGGIILFYFWFRQITLLTGNKIVTPLSLSENLFAMFQTLGYYFWLLLFPVRLNAEHPFPIPDSFWNATVAFPAVALLTLTAVLILFYRKSLKILCFSLCWTIFSLLPVSNLVFLSSRPVAEQRLYFPSLGICLLLALFIRKIRFVVAKGLFPEKLTAALIFAGLFFFFSVQTIKRNFDMRTPISFYAATVKHSPHHFRPHLNLGNALLKKERLDEALKHYNIARYLDPSCPTIYFNLGLALLKKNQIDQAACCFQSALQLEPNSSDPHNPLLESNQQTADAHYNLGIVLTRKGNPRQAVHHFKKALQINPDDENLHYNLGLALTKTGDLEAAVRSYRAAIQLNPNYADPHTALGLIFAAKNRYHRAISHFQAALERYPLDAETHLGLGICLFQTGQLEEAIASYQSALRLNPDYTDALFNLGVALTEKGRLEDAVKQFLRVIQQETDNADAFTYLSRIYQKRGDPHKARQYRLKAEAIKR